MGRKFTTIDRNEREYIPKDWKDENDKPEQNALKFKFKPLSKRQLAEFSDNSSRMQVHSGTVILGTTSIDIEVFKVAINGWENFIVDDKEYKFKRVNGLVDEDAINILDLDIISEVSNHIIEVSKVPEQGK